jgi:hypothetical protein
MLSRLICTVLFLIGSNLARAENTLIFSDSIEGAGESAIEHNAGAAHQNHAMPGDIIKEGRPEAGAATEEQRPQGPLSATDKIVKRFMALDSDESDGVSFEEYMLMVNQRAEDRFASMDGDGNGEVTGNEFRKFWKQRKAKWYRLKN